MSAVGSRSRGCRFAAAGASAVLFVATLVLASGPAQAAIVSIHDDSHVLDVTQVQNAAATLPDPVAVYTTIKDADDKAAFDRDAQAKVTAPTVVVIAVNTQSHHLAIRTGAKSRITQQAAATATQAFIDSYRGSPNYTAATVAALGSMRTAIQAGGPTRNGPQRRTTTHSSSGVSIGGLLCLLVVVAAVVTLLVRRRRQPRPAPTQIGDYDATGGYGQPGYGPAVGYGPAAGSGPGYGPTPGYGPGYGGPGVSPWVAGGVGAAAGGFLGYELGRNEGREEEREREERSDQGNDDGGFGGGGADGDYRDEAGSASSGGDCGAGENQNDHCFAGRAASHGRRNTADRSAARDSRVLILVGLHRLEVEEGLM